MLFVLAVFVLAEWRWHSVTQRSTEAASTETAAVNANTLAIAARSKPVASERPKTRLREFTASLD